MKGCEHCGILFEDFEPLGFYANIEESEVKAKLGKDNGIYLIEVKELGRLIVENKTFIQSVLSDKVPAWIIKRIVERDVNPLIKYSTISGCKIIYIGKAESDAKTLYKRFMDLLTGAHTNRNSLWTMLEHGWKWEFWYKKNENGQNLTAIEKNLRIDYERSHKRKPNLNRV